MTRTILIAALALLSPVAHAAPDPLSRLEETRIDIELKEAPVQDVLTLMGDIIGEPLTVDACVGGTLDLALRNATIRMTLEAIAAKLDLVYGVDAAGSLTVGCAEHVEQAAPVSLSMRGVTVPVLFEALAGATHRTASVQGCSDRRVDVEFHNAPMSAVIQGLAAELGAAAQWDGDVLRVTCD